MAHPTSFLAGLGVGAGAMYYLDPNLGRRRRGLLRDQVIHQGVLTCRAADVVQRDVRNRMYGTVAEIRASLRHDQPSDEVLIERVRAKIGRCVSHPAAIEVKVADGRVTLSGPILTDEVPGLLSTIQRVRGVRDVEAALDVHDEPGNVSALQGGIHRTGEPIDLLQEYWSPATRVLVGAAGLGLLATCLTSRTPVSVLLGTIGFGLSTRALSNLQTSRLAGLGASRRGIDIQAGIVIDAPIEKVFELFSKPENYSRLTDSIASVRNLGGGRYQKMVSLPGGAKLTLDERLTALEPNKSMRWRSEPSSMVKYAGTAWFNRLDDGRTQVQVCMTYNFPGGVLSHAAATLAGMNPNMLVDDFLMRAKAYLETGRQPRDAAEQERPTVEGQQSRRDRNQPQVVETSPAMQQGGAAVHNL
jgi:uncharacterized membrane protein